MYRKLWSVMLLAVASCDSDSPVATSQTIAEDSLLAAQVMSAKGDSNFFGPVDDRVYLEDLAEKKAAPKPKAVPVVAKPKPAPPPAPLLADVSVPLSEMPRKVERTVERPVRVGVVSSGVPVSVVTGDRACGKTFHAELVSSVRGSNGVVIPSGASATGEILSADKWGAGLSIRIRSLRHAGKSYPINSRVVYVLPEGKNGDACVRGGTRIDVKTTEPLRVVASLEN